MYRIARNVVYITCCFLRDARVVTLLSFSPAKLHDRHILFVPRLKSRRKVNNVSNL